MAIDYYFLMFYGIYPHVPNEFISHLHTISINLSFYFCLFVYYKACTVQPGRVTHTNYKHYQQMYQYDEIVYFKDNTCKSCEVIKPAKSKHCSTCRMCVARFDHHCIWVRQCIGLHNYKYFVSFIFSHTIVCLYAAYIGAQVIQYIIHKDKLWQATFAVQATKEIVAPTYFIIYKYIFYTNLQLCFATLLTFVMGVTLFFFMMYHLYLIQLGQSTAEKLKRSEHESY